MSEAFVSLEVAKALKEIGYPQNQWPQMIWDADQKELNRDLPGVEIMYEWYAAPTPLQTLEWLARKLGSDYAISSILMAATTSYCLERWDGARVKYSVTEAYDNPNDLILAILQHLQEAQ